MIKLYYPKYFTVKELVYPEMFNIYGNKALQFMDNRILLSIDQAREYFNQKVVVNTYQWNGDFKYRGLRPFNCPVGSKRSQHKFGRAIDFDIPGLTAEYVRSEIIRSQKHFPFITRMEKDVSWVHIDCMPVEDEKIILFGQY